MRAVSHRAWRVDRPDGSSRLPQGREAGVSVRNVWKKRELPRPRRITDRLIESAVDTAPMAGSQRPSCRKTRSRKRKCAVTGSVKQRAKRTPDLAGRRRRSVPQPLPQSLSRRTASVLLHYRQLCRFLQEKRRTVDKRIMATTDLSSGAGNRNRLEYACARSGASVRNSRRLARVSLCRWVDLVSTIGHFD